MQQLESILVADLVRAACRLARSGTGRSAVNATGIDRALWIAAKGHHAIGTELVRLPKAIADRVRELNDQPQE